MKIKATTWRELVIAVRELGYNKTRCTIKKQNGLWIWRMV